MNSINTDKKIYYTLRIAAAMCFIGHGAFGVITKPVWCNYFAVFGIGHDLAYQLMPVIGTCDILLGIGMLAYPLRAIPAWLVVWGIFTASLRPLSGEPFAEFIERAGNFGAPLVLLLIAAREAGVSKLMLPVKPAFEFDDKKRKQLITALQIIVFLLIAGHGWLNLIAKKGLIDQYTRLGFANPHSTATIIGVFEVAAALAVLIKPVRPFLMILFIWKMGSELFYPHWEFFEWVERGGSYGCLLALWFATAKPLTEKHRDSLFSTERLKQSITALFAV